MADARYVRSLCKHYSQPDVVVTHVLAILESYSNGLHPEHKAFAYDDGRVELLACIAGVVPVSLRGTEYNCPLEIILPFDYPSRPPIVQVVPSDNMQIKAGRCVSSAGRVTVPYLTDWGKKGEGCSLAPLLEALVSQFGQDYPLVSVAQGQRPPPSRPASNLPTPDYRSERGTPPPRPPPPSSQGPPRPPLPPQFAGRPQHLDTLGRGDGFGGLGRSDSVGSGSAAGPPPPPRPPLPPIRASTPAGYANGYQQAATPPSYQPSQPPPPQPSQPPNRQSTYEAPPPRPPPPAPPTSLHPFPQTSAQPSYQQRPTAADSFAGQPSRPPPPPNPYSPPQRNGTIPPYSTPPPLFTPSRPPTSPPPPATHYDHSQPPPGPAYTPQQAPVPSEARQPNPPPSHQPYSPQLEHQRRPQSPLRHHPPSRYESPPLPPQSNTRYSNQYQPQQAYAQELPPNFPTQSRHLPSHSYASPPRSPIDQPFRPPPPSTSSQAYHTQAPPLNSSRQATNILDAPEDNLSDSPSSHPAASQAAPPRPPNPEVLALRTRLHSQLSHALSSLSAQTDAELGRLDLLEADLRKGEPAILDEMQRLQAVRGVCENVRDRYKVVVAEGEARLGDYLARGEGPEVDEIVCSSTVVYNQLLELVAEDAALEDTIYHLGRGLNSETANIDLERFQKRVRGLAREQFVKRALINKIVLALAVRRERG